MNILPHLLLSSDFPPLLKTQAPLLKTLNIPPPLSRDPTMPSDLDQSWGAQLKVFRVGVGGRQVAPLVLLVATIMSQWLIYETIL